MPTTPRVVGNCWQLVVHELHDGLSCFEGGGCLEAVVALSEVTSNIAPQLSAGALTCM